MGHGWLATEDYIPVCFKEVSIFCHVKKMQNCFLDDGKAFHIARLLNDHGIQVILNGQSGSLIDPSFGCLWKLGMPKRNCMLIHLNEENDEPLDVGLVSPQLWGHVFPMCSPAIFGKVQALRLLATAGLALVFGLHFGRSGTLYGSRRVDALHLVFSGPGFFRVKPVNLPPNRYK